MYLLYENCDMDPVRLLYVLRQHSRRLTWKPFCDLIRRSWNDIIRLDFELITVCKKGSSGDSSFPAYANDVIMLGTTGIKILEVLNISKRQDNFCILIGIPYGFDTHEVKMSCCKIRPTKTLH